MSTNLEYRARERQRKREIGRQVSEAQREKGRQGFRARDKKQRRHFFVEMKKFCSGGDKMRNASGHQCKGKMSGSEKKSERERVRHFLHKKVSGSFTLWSCKTTAKKCTKKCAARAKLLFC